MKRKDYPVGKDVEFLSEMQPWDEVFIDHKYNNQFHKTIEEFELPEEKKIVNFDLGKKVEKFEDIKAPDDLLKVTTQITDLQTEASDFRNELKDKINKLKEENLSESEQLNQESTEEKVTQVKIT